MQEGSLFPSFLIPIPTNLACQLVKSCITDLGKIPNESQKYIETKTIFWAKGQWVKRLSTIFPSLCIQHQLEESSLFSPTDKYQEFWNSLLYTQTFRSPNFFGCETNYLISYQLLIVQPAEIFFSDKIIKSYIWIWAKRIRPPQPPSQGKLLTSFSHQFPVAPSWN